MFCGGEDSINQEWCHRHKSDEKKARFKESDPKLFKRIYHPRPIEFRDVEELDYKNPTNRPPFRHVWLKSKGDMPDDLRWHTLAQGLWGSCT